MILSESPSILSQIRAYPLRGYTRLRTNQPLRGCLCSLMLLSDANDFLFWQHCFYFRYIRIKLSMAFGPIFSFLETFFSSML